VKSGGKAVKKKLKPKEMPYKPDDFPHGYLIPGISLVFDRKIRGFITYEAWSGKYPGVPFSKKVERWSS